MRSQTRKPTARRSQDEPDPAIGTLDLNRFTGRDDLVQRLEKFGTEMGGSEAHRDYSL
jgi:hypothetical protein